MGALQKVSLNSFPRVAAWSWPDESSLLAVARTTCWLILKFLVLYLKAYVHRGGITTLNKSIWAINEVCSSRKRNFGSFDQCQCVNI